MDRHDMMCKYTFHIALEETQNKCHHFVMAKSLREEGLPDFRKNARNILLSSETSY